MAAYDEISRPLGGMIQGVQYMAATRLGHLVNTGWQKLVPGVSSPGGRESRFWWSTYAEIDDRHSRELDLHGDMCPASLDAEVFV